MDIEISQIIGKGVQIILAVVTLASSICAITKTKDPLTGPGKLYKILEACALNIGRAKDRR